MNSVRIVIYNKAQLKQFVALSETDDPDNLKLPGAKFEKKENGEEESPDEAAARELTEELGVTSEQVGLIRAGELMNDDGVSSRYIYTGRADLNVLQPSEEIHHTELLTSESIPEGKNRGHMQSAVALSDTVWTSENA
jgi:ADP-ribose pyrophosphatase YjhB (NUDIX family)